MGFLSAMMVIGILGPTTCKKLFGLLFKMAGRGFDVLEEITIGRRSRRRWDDEDDD